jgi:hypothetical protein
MRRAAPPSPARPIALSVRARRVVIATLVVALGAAAGLAAYAFVLAHTTRTLTCTRASAGAAVTCSVTSVGPFTRDGPRDLRELMDCTPHDLAARGWQDGRFESVPGAFEPRLEFGSDGGLCTSPLRMRPGTRPPNGLLLAAAPGDRTVALATPFWATATFDALFAALLAAVVAVLVRSGRARPRALAIAACLVASVGVAAFATWRMLRAGAAVAEDEASWARATPVEAHVVADVERRGGTVDRYDVRAHYTDRAGRSHELPLAIDCPGCPARPPEPEVRCDAGADADAPARCWVSWQVLYADLRRAAARRTFAILLGLAAIFGALGAALAWRARRAPKEGGSDAGGRGRGGERGAADRGDQPRGDAGTRRQPRPRKS